MAAYLPFDTLLGDEVEADCAGRVLDQRAEVGVLVGASGRTTNLQHMLCRVNVRQIELVAGPVVNLRYRGGWRKRVDLLPASEVEGDRYPAATVDVDTTVV